MKNKINLHMNQRRTLCYMVFFSLVSIFINIIIAIPINTPINNLNTLLHSDYKYSATTKEPLEIDSYYKYNAGISFILTEQAENRINADILMQVDNTQYTNNVYWNASQLGDREIAISEGLAITNKLNIGDVIYSKHIVNGLISEYKISEIIPDISASKVTKETRYSGGIIIMGYDEEYANNISKINLVFTEEGVNNLTSYAPENLLYREDEILFTIESIMPYLLVFIFLSILISVIVSLLIYKELKANFLRMVLLGFDKMHLDRAYRKIMWTNNILCIGLSVLVSFIILAFMHHIILAAVLIPILLITEIVTLFVTIYFTNKQLWRK